MGFSFLLMRIISCIVFGGLVYFIKHLCKSQMVKRKLHMQGIRGPSPSFFYGNVKEMQQIESKLKKQVVSHQEIVANDYTSTVFPYLEYWRKQYGELYTYSTGLKQHLIMNEAELVKKMKQFNTLNLGKPRYVSKRYSPLFGNGIMRSNGHYWALQRKIIVPEFFMDKVKSMVGLMVESTLPLLKAWEERIEMEGGFQAEITVDEELKGLSADVIARTCFGNSYMKGNEIFSKLRALHKILTDQGTLFDFTTFRLFPNKDRRKIRRLEREIESIIWETVKTRQSQYLVEKSKENDLMLILLKEAGSESNAGKLSPKQFIVDSCRSLYFAGHDTTAISASWCLMLLALHPEWQSRIREEVNQVLTEDHRLMDANSLSNLKTVTMVIHETLRLFPPAGFVVREALEEIRIGSLIVPKGVCIWTQIPALHRNSKIWGSDADKFRPERFADGISKACKFPQAYIPFGLGTRLCPGRNFAMVELKIIISLIVSKFKFCLSSTYKHSPVYRALIAPDHGVQILIQKV